MTIPMFRHCSGIYQIRNVYNGKTYIGQTTRLVDRKYNHFRLLKFGQHHSPILQNAYNKYGENCFVFEVLMYCDVDMLDHYEQLLVNSMKPQYNIRQSVVSNRGHKVSDETKRKLSLANMGKRMSEESRKKMSESRKGKKLPIETIKKISERMMGVKINLGRKQSPEHKKKRGDAMKKYWASRRLILERNK